MIDEELDESPFDQYLRLKYEGEDPHKIYECLAGLEDVWLIRGASSACKVSLEFVVKWSHTFLASQVLRDIDHSDPFWRALLRLAADFPEEFDENWAIEEARQGPIEEKYGWQLDLVGKPFLRGRKREIPTVEEALANEEAEQAEMEKASVEAKVKSFQPTTAEIRELRHYAIGTVKSEALATLIRDFAAADEKKAPSESVVIERVIATALEGSFKVRHSPAPHAPCPLCGGVASDPRSKGYSLPSGLTMHLKGEQRARTCPVFAAAQGLAREARATRAHFMSLGELYQNQEDTDDSEE